MDSPTATISAEDWAVMGRAAGVSAEEFKNAYEAALNEHQPGPNDRFELTIGPTAVDADGCESHHFDLDLYKTIGLGLDVTLCGSITEDWTLKLEASLKAGGMSVWSTTYTITPGGLTVCWDPQIGVAKAHLCIGITGTRACLNVSGEACYWLGDWRCAGFNEIPICFG